MTYANGRHSTRSTKAVDKRRNEYRKALLEAVSPEDFIKLVSVVKTKAIEGDLKAITLLFEYCLGRPPQAIEIEPITQDNEIQIHIVK